MKRSIFNRWVAAAAVAIALLPLAQTAHAITTVPLGKPVKLSWKIPVSRENGTPLRIADLAGYELYYVREDQKVSGVINIAKPDQSSYALNNLKVGIYYFAITAIDRQGAKSKLSKMVVAQVKG